MKAPIPLFDLGNVIVKVDFGPFFSWLMSRSRDPDSGRVRAVVHSATWADFELGELTPEQFASRLRKLYEAEFSREELEEKFCGVFPGPVAGMPELLAELAADGPVHCLSNTNEVHLTWLRRHRPELLRGFTNLYTSYELHQRKPDPGIYRGVAEALRVDPARLVFFDDLAENVEGAQRAGLRAHLFREAGQVRRVLKGIETEGDKA